MITAVADADAGVSCWPHARLIRTRRQYPGRPRPRDHQARVDQETLMDEPHDVVIRDGDSWDVRPLAGLCAGIIASTSLGRWLDPDPLPRALLLQDYFSWLITRSLRAGTTRVAEADGHPVGAALWQHCRPGTLLPCTDGDDSPFSRLHAIHAMTHPATDHHCLHVLAVVPTWRRHGIGAALLDDHHRHSRRGNYTLAAGPEACRFLQQHGYTCCRPPIAVADGLRVWLMRRSDQPPPAG
jgi:GNAT superfamily N-acetyltransferase